MERKEPGGARVSDAEGRLEDGGVDGVKRCTEVEQFKMLRDVRGDGEVIGDFGADSVL